MRLVTVRNVLCAAGVVGAAVAARTAWIAANVAAGYAAKMTCSLSLNSGQPPEQIRSELLDHALFAVAGLIRLQPADCCARATLPAGVGARAIWRRGFGCTLLAGRDEKEVASLGERLQSEPLDPALAWPDGDAAPVLPPPPAVSAAIEEAFRETGDGRVRQTKAVLVVYRGRLIAERYAQGYSASTPMISWSMAESVLASLVGIAVSEGRLELKAPARIPEWASADDPRHAITLDQLLRMSSGLGFDETYGALNDVSEMLFTQPDVAAYAAASPAAAPPDSVWSPSSGTSNIVARLLLAGVGGSPEAFIRYARERLFDPVGMRSAFFEHDAAGTPVASSFLFMTARDWARFGELTLRDGVWKGRRLLPEGWVRYETTATPRAPRGQYGAHWWLNAGAPGDPAARLWPSLPADASCARGYGGQWLLVVPSRELVLVRLGISFPDDGRDGADGVEELARKILGALRAGDGL